MKNLILLNLIIAGMFFTSCENSEGGFALLEEVSITQADSSLDGEIAFESWFPEEEQIRLKNSDDVTVGVKLTNSSVPTYSTSTT